MKNVLLFFALCAPVLLFSQDKGEPQLSEAEKVSGKAGSLVEKQVLSIGKVKGVTVDVLTFKNLSDKTESKAMRFAITEAKQYSSEKRSALDADEIDGLIASLKLLKTVFAEKRETYTEVTYTSRTNMKAGAYYSVKDAKWQGFVEVGGRYDNATAYLSAEDLDKLLELVEAGKAKM